MNKPNTKSLFVILGAAIIIVIGANQMVSAKSDDNSNQKTTHVAKPDTLSLTPHVASRLHYTAPSSSSSSQKQAEASSQPAQATSTTSVASSQAPAVSSSTAPAAASTQPAAQQQTQATAPSTVQSAPAARTDGMNWNGHHYDISSFSGDNASIPEWTNNVYRWTELPNFYAVEGRSYAGQHISELYVGAPIVLNGRTYHVSSIDPSVLRLSDASSEYVFDKAQHHAFVLQTCNDVNSTYVRFYWVD